MEIGVGLQAQRAGARAVEARGPAGHDARGGGVGFVAHQRGGLRAGKGGEGVEHVLHAQAQRGQVDGGAPAEGLAAGLGHRDDAGHRGGGR